MGFHSGEWRVGGWQSLYWPDEWPWQPSLGRWVLRLKIGSLSQRTGLRPRGEIGVEPPSHRWWRKSERGSAGWSEATSFGGAILVRNGPRLQAIQKGTWVEKRAGQWPSLFPAKVVGDFPRDEDWMPQAHWLERWALPPRPWYGRGVVTALRWSCLPEFIERETDWRKNRTKHNNSVVLGLKNQ